MVKKILLSVVMLLCAAVGFSRHLKGGWISYEYLGDGSSANTSRYVITVNQYLLCSSEGGQIDEQVYVGIFDGGTNALNFVLTIPHTDFVTENKTDFDPCISGQPPLCYRIDRYVDTVDLANNTAGYTLGVQRCCRIENIVNLINSQDAGITYSVTIPGVVNNLVARNNSSPLFGKNDLSVICINARFTLNFSAVDNIDHDSLVYSFCSGLIGGDNSNTQQGTQPNPPSNPPFKTLTYAAPYSGSSPLGSQVIIDSKTGIISGTAPPQAGDYVIAVCVTEYRQGIAIANTRKEIHFTVGNCQLAGAELEPVYATCDGYTFSFANESLASNINEYKWSFGFKDTTSSEPTPTVTFPEAGQYNIKLVVKNEQGCEDSANSVLNVYPGFAAGFTVAGSCLESAYVFKDNSVTAYGEVNSWRWDFGDLQSTLDTSSARSPQPYHYTSVGTAQAQLIVTNTKGCTDTLIKEVAIFEKPIVSMPFYDTLICRDDELLLSASTDIEASYEWAPNINIRNADTDSPLVNPSTTTTYVVTVDDGNGCKNQDSVLVNVIDQVTLIMPADTIICLTDTVQLTAQTDGLVYTWTPAGTLSNSSALDPVATPRTTTTYRLRSAVGGCFTEDSITVYTAPYPTALATGDRSICYGTTAQLSGSYTGNRFTWSPRVSLSGANTLHPLAGPTETTTYVLTVRDTSATGCPKAVRDSVTIVVIPPLQVFAGSDTTIVYGQTLQLQASGATNYTWSPNTGMSNTTVSNPLVNLPASINRIVYMVKGVTPEGCNGTDSITVVQYKSLPDIFIPSAFTPDNDGVNDVLKPITAGIKQFIGFSIYNRLGQLVYTTRNPNQGWNGIFKGAKQPAGTYVYEVSAIDYLDTPIRKKGTIVLLR